MRNFEWVGCVCARDFICLDEFELLLLSFLPLCKSELQRKNVRWSNIAYLPRTERRMSIRKCSDAIIAEVLKNVYQLVS